MPSLPWWRCTPSRQNGHTQANPAASSTAGTSCGFDEQRGGYYTTGAALAQSVCALSLQGPAPTRRSGVHARRPRDRPVQRTKDALAAAKARVLGNPHLTAARAVAHTAQRETADAFAANVRPIIEQIRASGVQSLRGVARAR